ncbi:hypothetical protein DC522_05980 [Microvirga sp. KLBC 81]|nr:hypothetical protein DC522_05980 [Microvirga sp. KLBC 81]
MIVGKDQLPDTNEGYLVLPRRIGWAIVVGGVLYAAGTGWAANGYVSRLEKLEDADARFFRERDERRAAVDQRLARLEQSQDRITRLEEQVKISIEMLKEIKDELKRR